MMFLSNPTWWQAAIEGAVLIAGVVNFFSAAFFWRARATFVSQQQMEEMETDLNARIKVRDDNVDRQIRSLEGRALNMDIGIARVEGEVRGVGMMLTRVEHQVGLLVEYRMMEGKP